MNYLPNVTPDIIQGTYNDGPMRGEVIRINMTKKMPVGDSGTQGVIHLTVHEAAELSKALHVFCNKHKP